LTEQQQGEEDHWLHRAKFFSFAMQFRPERLPADDLLDANGLRQAALQVRFTCAGNLGLNVAAHWCRPYTSGQAGKGRLPGTAIWVEDNGLPTLCGVTAALRLAAGTSSWYFKSTAWRTNVQPGQWMTP